MQEAGYATIKRGSVKIPSDSAQHRYLHAHDLPHSHVKTDGGKKTITRSNTEAGSMIPPYAGGGSGVSPPSYETKQDSISPEKDYIEFIPKHHLTPGAKLYTPEEMGYIRSPVEKKCGNCEYFNRPDICSFPLNIPVDPETDCCNEFEPVKKEQEAGPLTVRLKNDIIDRNTINTENGDDAESREDHFLKLASHAMAQAYMATPSQVGEQIAKARAYLDAAIQAHEQETKETNNQTPTHGSSSFLGRNVDAVYLSDMINRYEELKARGIPDKEAMRTIAQEFGDGSHFMEPTNSSYWPLQRTGPMDTVDKIWIKTIPASAFSPESPDEPSPNHDIEGARSAQKTVATPDDPLVKKESVAISGSLNNLSIGSDLKNTENGMMTSSQRDKEPYSAAAGNSPMDQTDRIGPFEGISAGGQTGIMPPEAQWHGKPLDNSDPSKPYTKVKIQPEKPGEEQTWPKTVETEEEDDEFECPQCPMTFDDEQEYVDHLNKHMSVDPRHDHHDQRLKITPFGSIPSNKKKVVEPKKKVKLIMEASGPLYARYKYNGHMDESDYCKSFNGAVFDISKREGRPVLPSENLQYTSQHPNCECTWETIDPIIYDNVQPTPLLGHQKNRIQMINRLIGQKSRYGSLHLLTKDGGVSQKTVSRNPRKETITICKNCYAEMGKDTRRLVQEALELHKQFRWLTPGYIDRLKALQKDIGGAIYLVRASAEAITDHRAEGEPYRRKLDARELLALTRTGISKGIDINHEPKYRTDGHILDGEFDDYRREIQYVVHTEDNEIIDAIERGIIDATSINGGSPRNEEVSPCNDGCNAGECELCVHPRGVVLGEDDGIAFTWVVSKPDWSWKGIQMEAKKPGVSKTKIERLA